MTVNEKISALRELMKNEGISAYIIPSTDPHMSEYVADYWEARKWISSFTGSAGTVVVTLDEAGLWTDGRYHLQGEQQLEGSEIKLFKQGVAGVPNFDQWLASTLKESSVVGVDARVYSVAAYKSLEALLKKSKIKLNGDHDFIKYIWEDRSEIPSSEAYLLDVKFSGKSAEEKIAEVRNLYQEKGANCHLVASLDDIAWILNLRGSDVSYNPVSISYLLIENDTTTLFIKRKKLSDETKELLFKNGVEVKSYKAVESYLKNNVRKSTCLIDPDRMNQKVLNWISKRNKIVKSINPSTVLKSVKNETEIKNFRIAMEKDGVAMSKFLHWLDNNVASGEVTEIKISEKLIEFRSQEEDFVGESFSTIAGYRGNGAIIHYFATPETSKTLEPSSLVLVDSGAQYKDGTTDLTRTIALGPLTEEEKKDYTLVLKGHIQLALAKFPEGTRGSQLDTLARQALLREGLNYMHGTGHGVGFFMNVHEGPHSIRPDENPNLLLEGSVSSNEPGMYRADKHGIRIENLVVAKEFTTNEFGKFLDFETITLCPIDTRPIIFELLGKDEVEWLNSYHKEVYSRISPRIDGEVLEWLKEATKEI